jgi:hypothetical protein
MNNTLSVPWPIPPEVAMPEPLQTIFLWLTIVAAVAILVIAGFMSVKRRSAVPVLMALGGFTSIIMESVVTFLGHAVHPPSGQIMLFEAASRAIPWHIALGYMAGFGLFYLTLYPAFVEGRLRSAQIWKTCLITAALYFVGEAYPVSHGLWVYYDYQPMQIWHGTAPLTWNFLNACCMMVSATVIFVALPYLKNLLSQLSILLLAPVGAYMGHMGAGFPMYNAMNSTLPTWAIEISGALSIVLALVLIWLCDVVLQSAQNQRAAA